MNKTKQKTSVRTANHKHVKWTSGKKWQVTAVRQNKAPAQVHTIWELLGVHRDNLDRGLTGVTGVWVEPATSILRVHDGQLRQWAGWQRHTAAGSTRFHWNIRNQPQDCIVTKLRKTHMHATCFTASSVKRVRILHDRHSKYKHFCLHINASLGNFCSWKKLQITGLRLLIYFLAVHSPTLIIRHWFQHLKLVYMT